MRQTDKNPIIFRSRVIIAIIALLGFGIMAYLTYIHYAEASSFCDISETVSCDVVTTSIYSEIFGLPVSILGLGYFFLVFLLMVFSGKSTIFQNIFFITLFVLMPSLYLSLLELTVIKAFCVLCETSKLLMIGILITSYLASKAHKKIEFRMMAPVIIAGVVAAFITYFAQAGTPVKRDYSEFVACLNEQGVVYYKSFRCSNCKRQEALLGEAYPNLNSVECHPEGPAGNPELCLAKRVDKTPTFIMEPEGIEIKRLEGLQPLQNLAAFAGCELENEDN
jgi:uncharacterized membrane protein